MRQQNKLGWEHNGQRQEMTRKFRPAYYLVVAILVLSCNFSQSAAQLPTAAAQSPTTTAQSPTATATYLPLVTNQAAYWRPMPGTSWQIQLSGTIDSSVDAELYDIDLFDAPQAVIDELHSQGRKVMCYFSAGSYEDWRSDAGQFPAEVLGNDLEGWPGEKWLDVRRLDLLGPIMQARLELAHQKHCNGVDPDNMDGYQNDSGFPLTPQDQLAYNIWIAGQAHERGLAVGLKNDLGQIPDLVAHYDWALNEECFQYNECELLLPFTQAGKPVFGIEYQGDTGSFCPQANTMDFDFLKKHLELDAWLEACR